MLLFGENSDMIKPEHLVFISLKDNKPGVLNGRKDSDEEMLQR